MSRRVTLLLIIAIGCLTIATDTFLIALPPYLVTVGFSQSQIGWFLGLTAPIMIVTQPAWGYTADARGYIRVLRWGAFLNVLATTLYYFGTYLPALFWLGRLLQGLALGGIGIGSSAFVVEKAQSGRKGHMAGIISVPALVMLGVAPAIGTWIIQYGKVANLCFLSALCALGILAIGYCLPDQRTRPDISTVIEKPFGVLIKNATIRPALFLSIAMGLSYMSWASLLSQTVKFANSFAFFTLAFGGAAAFARSILNEWFVRRGYLRLPGSAMLLNALALIAIPHLSSPAGFVLAGGIAGIGYGLLYPTFVETLSKLTETNQLGRVLSLAAASGCLGTLIGGPGCGWLAQNYGFNPAFLLAGVLVGIAVIWFIIYHTLYCRID